MATNKIQENEKKGLIDRAKKKLGESQASFYIGSSLAGIARTFIGNI